MNLIIMNRRGIIEWAKRPFTDTTAVISITDVGYPFAKLEHQPQYRLEVAFNDVDGDVFLDELGPNPTNAAVKALEEKYQMLSDEQAVRIAQFYFDAVSVEVDTFIVQCEYGQSRSAAVVAAIREFTNGDGISIFADDRYYPNKVVFRKVLRALQGCVKAARVAI